MGFFQKVPKKLSRTRDIVAKITQVIQDIGLIRSANSTKGVTSHYKLKRGQKGLHRKCTSANKGNDEQSGEGCKHSPDSTTMSESTDPSSTLYTPTHHETNSHASPSSRPSTPRSPTRTHSGPGDPLPPLSASSEPAVTCRRDNSVDQNESSDSCGSSSCGTSPPSDELGQDSREGMEEEERPDPGGGKGMTGDLQGGSVQ
jgi:hypothetical protein